MYTPPMDRLVYYCEGLQPEVLQVAADAVEVSPVYSRHRLVQALVDDPAVVGVVIDINDLSEEWGAFITSALRSFPLLPVLLIYPDAPAGCPPGVTCVRRDASDDRLTRALNGFAGGDQPRDRRRYHRYQWPLRAALAGDDTVHRISEISAGGAYLEPLGPGIESGKERELAIYFQNFRMSARCIILDPRGTAGARSTGFGVRFLDLSAQAEGFINRIVQDALIELLLDPETEPGIPVLHEEEDLLSIGDEFALT